MKWSIWILWYGVCLLFLKHLLNIHDRWWWWWSGCCRRCRCRCHYTHDDWMDCHEIQPYIVCFFFVFIFVIVRFLIAISGRDRWSIDLNLFALLLLYAVQCLTIYAAVDSVNRVNDLSEINYTMVDCANDTMNTHTLHFFRSTFCVLIQLKKRETTSSVIVYLMTLNYDECAIVADLLFRVLALMCTCVCVIECTLQQSIIKLFQ